MSNEYIIIKSEQFDEVCLLKINEFRRITFVAKFVDICL